MWGCFDNCRSVLVMCIFAFTEFIIVRTVFLYCFFSVYLFLFDSSALLPPSDNSIAVINNNNKR